MRFPQRARLTFVLWLLLVAAAAQHPVITEVLPSNHTVNMDPDRYAFSDWIELHNPYGTSLSLTGYWLSTRRSLSQRWRFPYGSTIPAGGYLLLWADSTLLRQRALHLPFRLQREGGTVYLWHSDRIVDSLPYPPMLPDISWGLPGGGGEAGFFPHPTPGAPNGRDAAPWVLPSLPPSFSREGGFYENKVKVYLYSKAPEAVIHYTLDGSEPGLSSPLYQGPIEISSNTVLRAAAWEPGHLRSEVRTETYFIQEDVALPVISLAIDPYYFWDDSVGFYVEGTNGLTGWQTGHGPSPKSNFNCDWKRPVNITFFDERHRKGFSADGQVKVYGGWTRGAVIKSLALYTYKPIDYRLFPERAETRYTSFILRNGGNEWARTRLRDAVLQSLAINQADVDLQANRPAVLFINGEFWGVMNIREKINADYIRTHYGIRQDRIDYIESYRTLKAGDWEHYRRMRDFLATHDLADPASFLTFNTMVDVEEMLNYFMVGIYSGHGDWIYNRNNNLRLWRPRRDGGRWRWLLYDCDGAFTSPNARGISAALNASDILAAVLKNEQARRYFVNTFTALLNNAFTPERAVHMVDSLKRLYEHDMPRHIAKWRNTDAAGNPAWWKDPSNDRYIQGQDGYGGPCLSGYSQWEKYFSYFRYVASARTPALLKELHDLFGLGDAREVRLSMVPSAGGQLSVNGVSVHEPDHHGTWFEGQTIILEAEARPGYQFKGWYSARMKAVPLVPSGAVWRYLDDGSDQGTAWRDPAYDDSHWKSGAAQLGYGDGDEVTTVSYGPDADNKYLTTWFRKHFDVPAPLPQGELRLDLLADDAAIVYLNGQEVVRENLPAGTVNYRTAAVSAVGGEAEKQYKTSYIPASLLREGENLLAVEIHQVSPVSSDISFDLMLATEEVGIEDLPVSREARIRLTITEDTALVALFDSSAKKNTLFINEVMPRNHYLPTVSPTRFTDWIELYNLGDEAVSLEGLYLTPNRENPIYCPYRPLPGEDILEAKEHLTLWADGSEVSHGRHLNFKLQGGDGAVYLFRRMGGEMVLLDSVVYEDVPLEMALARLPDGSGPWQLTDAPTAGRDNRLWFAPPMNGIRINEIHVAEDPRENEWIELYNANDVAVDAGGLFLTDDLDRPGRWRLPLRRPWQTLIPPHGYLVIGNLQSPWRGHLQLSFDFDARQGETGLAVWENDRLRYLDYQRYRTAAGMPTTGRFPDGAGSWQPLAVATPGEGNILTATPTLSLAKISIHPNPTEGRLFLRLGDPLPPDPIVVRILSLTGRVLATYRYAPSKVLTLDLQDLQKGVYLLETTAGSRSYRCRLVIR